MTLFSSLSEYMLKTVQNGTGRAAIHLGAIRRKLSPAAGAPGSEGGGPAQEGGEGTGPRNVMALF